MLRSGCRHHRSAQLPGSPEPTVRIGATSMWLKMRGSTRSAPRRRVRSSSSPMGKIEQRADNETVPLVVPRVGPLFAEGIRVLRLFVEVGGRVSCVRPGVGGRPFDLTNEAAVQRQREAVVRR